MKIAIIGYSGAGKSTLAEKLGKHYEIEPLYLDTIWWLPGWIERSETEMCEIVEQYLDTHENWIIDGTYSKHGFGRRMEEADQIVFMEFSRMECLRRAWQRKREYHGKNRPSRASGCPETMRVSFVWWLIWSGRVKSKRDRFRQVCEQYQDKTVRIRNQRQLDLFEQECGL